MLEIDVGCMVIDQNTPYSKLENETLAIDVVTGFGWAISIKKITTYKGISKKGTAN